MANFWGNSSSQYIAKKIIWPDFCAPQANASYYIFVVTIIFGKVLVRVVICTYLTKMRPIAAILGAKRLRLHKTNLFNLCVIIIKSN